MRAAPIIGSALSTPIAGIPGATAGNALGALGATDAIVNRLPEIPGQLSRGEYMDAAVNAATGALDLYGAGMVSPLLKSAKSAAGEAGKYLTTQTPLKNTYKYNPWAFKSNPEAYYRMIGDEGYADALQSGVIRANQKIPLADNGEPFGGMTTPEFDVPYFSKGRPWDETYQGPYMIEAKNVPMQGRSAYPETAYVPQNTIMSTDPNLNFYRQDWLQGYRQINKSKQLPGSPNNTAGDRITGPGPLMLGLSKYTHEVKNPAYFQKMLDSYSTNRLSNQSKQYFQSIIKSVEKQGGLATKKQYDILQRLRTGDFNYGKKEYGGWLDKYQDYNYIKYKDLSLSKGTGWLDNYK
jgi:hypothetical protein